LIDRDYFRSLRAMQPEGDIPANPVSDLAVCIQSVMNEGRAVAAAHSSGVDDTDALPVLERLDRFTRDELALELPTFSPATALWAGRLFHQLCRFIVCRDIPEEQINLACAVACPEPRGPETDWSADLTLRHLPNLFQLARHLSNADPLVGQIKRIAADWPLSSVGIGELDTLNLESFVHHPARRRLYADRINAAGDRSRLGHAQLDDLLRADIGIHRDLAPTVAAALFETSHDTH
jgi:hypothetical protein